MEYEWRITDENGGDPTPIIEKMILEHPMMRPQRIVVDSDHAEFVEFGSMPSTAPARPESERGKPTDVELKFREWVKKRGIGGGDVNGTARRIYRHIMQNGMAPMPFMRPAMYYVTQSIEYMNDNNPYLDEGHSIRDIAEWIIEEMKTCLDMNDMVVSGELRDSIQDPEDFDPQFEEPTSMPIGNVSEDIWSDPTLGRNNRLPPQRYRGLNP